MIYQLFLNQLIMKTIFLTLSIFTLMMTETLAQETDIKAVKACITDFVKAGDTHDTGTLEKLIDENSRIIMNQLFGMNGVMTVDKATYISKIASKEWGGDQRKTTFLDVDVNGKNAYAKVEMKGANATFLTYLILVKDKEGTWKIISDTPTVL